MPLSLQIIFIGFMVIGASFLVFYFCSRYFFIKDFDIHTTKIIQWLRQAEQLFFDENETEDSKKKNIKLLGDQLQNFYLADKELNEESKVHMEALVKEMRNPDATYLTMYKELALFETKI